MSRKRTRRGPRRGNPMSGLMLMNPMHRLSVYGGKGRIRVSRKSRLARRSRGFMLNPFAGALRMPALKPVFGEVIGVAAGFVAVKAVQKYVIPPAWSATTIGQVGTKLGAVAMVYVASGVVLKSKPSVRQAILVGGVFSVALDLLNQYLPMQMNSVGLGSLGYQIPSAPRPVAGLGSLGYQIPQAPSVVGLGNTGIQERY